MKPGTPKKSIQKINRNKCKHSFIQVRTVRTYRDFSGFKVYVKESECDQCGLLETRKYY